ncbi:MAG: patatin-like phospholipase family protein [Acidobacteriota bacterium]
MYCHPRNVFGHLCRKLTAALIFFTGAHLACASDPEPARKRPTIGLVLEGGGALGFAHIGVIRWLEEHHILVDFIAGTSMGGVVGGMYAAGNSPDQIGGIVQSIDWPLVLGGAVPFQDLSFRRKEDKLALPNRLQFGLRHGLSLPSGLNAGHEVGLVIDRTFLPYYDLHSFDDLPIPFRAVATELISGNAKVFGDGPLPLALRATIAIPAIFAPIRIDGQVYSDGSTVDNLPVDVAKAMGADIVIAVYLDEGAFNPKSLSSLIGVATRSHSILVTGNEQQNRKLADILVPVDVSGFGEADFQRGSEIIPKGDAAAEKMSAALRRLSVDDATWKDYLTQRDSRKRTDVPVPQFIAVDDGSPAALQQITTALRDLPGHPIESAIIDQDLSTLRGTGVFASLGYAITTQNGQPGLLIHPVPTDNSPPFLNLGITLNGSDPNAIQLGIGARLTFLDVAGAGSEWRTELSVGLDAGGTTELFRPLSARSKWFVAPHAYFKRDLFDQYATNDGLVAQYKERRDGFGVDAGYLFGRRAQLRIGEDLVWYGDTRTIGAMLGGPDFSIRSAVSSLRFQYFGQDDALVPRQGAIANASIRRYSQQPNGTGGYQQAEISAIRFVPISPHDSIYGGVGGGTSFGAKDLGLAGFRLGGPFNLSAYGRNELLGTQYFSLKAGYIHRLFDLPSVLGSVYGIAFYETAKMYRSSSSSSSLPQSGSIGVVMKSFIGPLYGGGSFGDNGHRGWWFGLGRIF